jgi:pyrimidine operon attenuation protein/uracil phosphoribosyltransferase
MATEKKYILDKSQVERKIRRLAFEIAERNLGADEIYFVAIKDNGVTLSKKIQLELQSISDIRIHILELTLDKRIPKEINLSSIPPAEGAIIIVIDDVASSGKTMLYALKPFLEIHPKKVETLVLVERTHKAFPIQVDYVGLSVATTLQEHIYVEVVDGAITGAYMD